MLFNADLLEILLIARKFVASSVFFQVACQIHICKKYFPKISIYEVSHSKRIFFPSRQRSGGIPSLFTFPFFQSGIQERPKPKNCIRALLQPLAEGKNQDRSIRPSAPAQKADFCSCSHEHKAKKVMGESREQKSFSQYIGI